MDVVQKIQWYEELLIMLLNLNVIAAKIHNSLIKYKIWFSKCGEHLCRYIIVPTLY